MKRILLIIFLMTFFATALPQGLKIHIQNGFGATIINMKKVIGNDLNNWNTYSYELAIQALISTRSQRFRWMPEAGVHRLYYWEEQYFVYLPGPTPRWRWGTVWTAHAGLGIEKPWGEHGYIQGGANARYFLDGSGIAPGLMGGIGLRIPVSKMISIPVGIRTDVIFGNGTPIAFCLCAGVEIGKRERK